jgi:hypothetical protein
MLIIRREQQERFRQLAIRDFKRRVRQQMIQDGYRLPDIDAVTFDAFLDRAIVAAKDHGITIEYDVYLFAVIMARFGEAFYRDIDWAREVLSDKTLATGSERAAILYKRGLDHGLERGTWFVLPSV